MTALLITRGRMTEVRSSKYRLRAGLARLLSAAFGPLLRFSLAALQLLSCTRRCAGPITA
jgi:hypothetical protein